MISTPYFDDLQNQSGYFFDCKNIKNKRMIVEDLGFSKTEVNLLTMFLSPAIVSNLYGLDVKTILANLNHKKHKKGARRL